ncbi:hypothetical protein ACN3XK_73480 [Actinomadura welshii]
MAGYRIHLVDGARRELSADRCRYTGSRYVFERESAAGDWRVVHEVAVADVAQLHDGVDLPDRRPNS